MADAQPDSDGPAGGGAGQDDAEQRRARAASLREQIAKFKSGHAPKPTNPRDFIEQKMAEERKKAEQSGDAGGEGGPSA